MNITYSKRAVKAINGLRERLVGVIDCLPETEQALLFEIAMRFVSDDTATPDDIAVHNEAMAEYTRGETVPHSAINWN